MISEVSLLHYNPAHKWYYLKNHGTEDLLVFRNTDSQGELPRMYLIVPGILMAFTWVETGPDMVLKFCFIGAFHAAVPNPYSTGPSRESVEVRIVAFY